MNGKAAQTALSFMIILVGLGLLVAGAVAAFVSSNSSASTALIAVGVASLLAILFRDRIQEAKIGDFEIKLARHIKDQLRTVLNLKVKGNYEGSERELRQAFDRFVGELDPQEAHNYRISKTYQGRVYKMLERIVSEKFGGQVQNSSATGSFYPLVDAVLQLDGARVREMLDEQKLELCPDLVKHLEQHLLVGVTIRPGPDLEPDTLVDRLRSNVQNGALNATCFLLIQNCLEKHSGESFRSLARQQDMHATSVLFPAEGKVEELDYAITQAILTICSEQLPLRVRTDGIALGVSHPSTVLERRTGV